MSFKQKLLGILKRIGSVFTSRLVIVGLLIVLQIAWLVVIAVYLLDYYNYINIATIILGVIMILVVVNIDEPAEYKLPWMLVIVVSPIFGTILFLCFGNNHASRLLKKRYRKLDMEAERLSPQNEEVLAALAERDPVAAGQARYMYESSHAPVFDDTETKFFPMGEDAYPVMLEELRKAERFIFLEYFIVEEGEFWNSVLEILTEKAQAGVEVRFMYDDIGSIGKVPVGYIKKLKKAGLKAQVFRRFIPLVTNLHNNRDHRKILVVDNRVAFTGGFNLADEYINKRERFGVWKDTGLMVKGRIVTDFTAMFLTLWDMQAGKNSDVAFYATYRCTEGGEPGTMDGKAEKKPGYVVFYGDGPRPFYEQQVGKNVYLNIINAAQDYVYISTPYLVCDDELMGALRLAARRGVDVRLITPHIPDKKTVFVLTRSNYQTLIEAGVKIYEYTPGFIHAKTFVCDEKYATVGTINLDYRSLVHHFECGAWMYGTDTVRDVKADFLKTFEECELISPERARLNVWQRLLKSVMQVIAPLL